MPPPNFRDLIRNTKKTYSFKKVMAGRGASSTYDGRIGLIPPPPPPPPPPIVPQLALLAVFH